MKLIPIEETPVPDASGALGQKSAAVQQANQVFEQGMVEVTKEIVKSQHYQAAADLATGLESAKQDLLTNKTISNQQLKDALGGQYDSLPPEIKQLTTKPVFNPVTQQMEDTDREDIPMYAVAGHIFAARADKALNDAAGNFTGGGWADEFKAQGEKEIAGQKMALSRSMIKDMQEHLTEQNTTAAINLANAGRPEQARAVLAGDRVMDLKHKDLVLKQVDKITQEKPLYDALRTNNISDMARALTQLGDNDQYTSLNPEERQSFTHRMEAEIDAFQRRVKGAGDEMKKSAAEDGWNGIFTKERNGERVSNSDIPMPGVVTAEAQKSMISYVATLNKGERPATDWSLYAGLLEQSKDRTKFMNTNLMNYRDRLGDTEFKQLLEIQMGLKGGNPEAYDHFQTTDEAINARLLGDAYKIDPHDKDNAAKLGYIKTLVQHDLASAQETNNGKPLSLEERDATIDKSLAANIDPRKEKWAGLSHDAATINAADAGIPASTASDFRKAVAGINDKFSAMEPAKKTAELKKQYEDYASSEPAIERAFNVLAGKMPNQTQAIQAWAHYKQNYERLRHSLLAGGGFSDDPKIRDFRIASMAVNELLNGARLPWQGR